MTELSSEPAWTATRFDGEGRFCDRSLFATDHCRLRIARGLSSFPLRADLLELPSVSIAQHGSGWRARVNDELLTEWGQQSSEIVCWWRRKVNKEVAVTISMVHVRRSRKGKRGG
jgi:hypothetical protein